MHFSEKIAIATGALTGNEGNGIIPSVIMPKIYKNY